MLHRESAWDHSHPVREHQGRENLLQSLDAGGCFAPESGHEECQSPKIFLAG